MGYLIVVKSVIELNDSRQDGVFSSFHACFSNFITLALESFQFSEVHLFQNLVTNKLRRLILRACVNCFVFTLFLCHSNYQWKVKVSSLSFVSELS